MSIIHTKIQVRYVETDQMGVVYHSNYLVWFELGRTAFLNASGLDYLKLEGEGFFSPLIEVEASFKSPVRYGEEAAVETWVDDYDGLRVTYGYDISVGERLCVTGRTKHVCVRKEDFKPVSLRRNLPDWHEFYERVKRRKEG